MADDFTRCSSRECHITGYDVTVDEGTVTDTIEFTIVDACNTLHDNCRAKAILVKVYQDYLIDDGVLDDPKAACVYAQKCSSGGAGMAFYNKTYVLVVDPAVNVPAATVTTPASASTVTVALPITCANVFA